MKLDVRAFTLAGGIFWGFGVFLLTWWLILTGSTTGRAPLFSRLIGRVYPGYRVSPAGSIIGLLWGFIDGFFAAGIFAVLYNRLVR